ncbi:MAG: hypothetical protein EZS28_015176 [Streblomastix strix]|uniref:Uncharacterized protein n=1 Tax=Streblomastix strix TaxID=222440 RepID=A0A5J4W387_9EUKA|nr:MAG: hypothetical protein EZS28_015176 [Streblomastix strix]
MNARAEDQLITMTGKTKQWLVGLLLFGLVVCPYTTIILIRSSIETTLIYDPSSLTLTVVKIRNRFQRLFCMDEESRISYDMTFLSYMYIGYGCCCTGDGLEFKTRGDRKVETNSVFDADEMKNLVDTIKSGRENSMFAHI